jgi:hypothetical protein
MRFNARSLSAGDRSDATLSNTLGAGAVKIALAAPVDAVGRRPGTTIIESAISGGSSFRVMLDLGLRCLGWTTA